VSRGTPKPKPKPRRPSSRKANAGTRARKPRAARTAKQEPDSGRGVLQAASTLARGLAIGVGRLGTGVAWLLTQRGAQRLVAGGLLSAALVGTSFLVRERVEAAPRHSLSARLVDRVQAPPGLSLEAAEMLSNLRLRKGANAFDPSVVPGVAARLARLPWVEHVESVELNSPNLLRFKLRTHRPLARLPGEEVVSQAGATLPARYAQSPQLLPLFVGVAAEGGGRLAALRAGALVLSDLGALAAQVARVDLSNLYGARDPRLSEVVVTFTTGLVVDWGRPGNDERPCRPASQRCEDLRAFLAAYPQAKNLARVSVRWDRVTFTLRSETQVATRR
jgi:cell division septal protein FtsQ